jgi:hypothetical protein
MQAEKADTPDRRIRLSLFWQIFLATLIAGVVPLLLISYNSTTAIEETGSTAQDVAATELDNKSIEALQVRAKETTKQVSALLAACVQDALYVSHLDPTYETYLAFFNSRTSGLWIQTGSQENPQETIKTVPLYREMAYIDKTGQETLRIKDGVPTPEEQLRFVADPANTTYLTERYFARAKALPAGEVYVSPVMSWYVTMEAQPAQAIDAATSPFEYPDYEAIIRFAAPVYGDNGQFQGVVVLSLDHRHVMEKVNHIYSVSGEVAWPDYASGNYAYMLDYEGWLIAHPNLATLRGLDENGELMPTQTKATLDQNLPFNMRSSDIKEQAIEISSAVLAGEEGNTRSVNLEGALKADIYVPIYFSHGVYGENGIFGGLVLSENVQNVEKAGEISKNIINEAVNQIKGDIIWIAGLSLIIFIVAAVFVSRNIINPIGQLTEASRIMEKGELELGMLNRLLQRRVEDEVTELTRVFKQMAKAVQLRERRLREEVRVLRIQIDEAKKQEEVDKIVKSEIFRDLQEKAQAMRERRRERQENRDQ